jgi:hypothetical protein
MLVSQPGPEVSRIEARPVFKRPEQTFRRLQLLHSSVLTSELVLGMPCAALQPTSKPGRPHDRSENAVYQVGAFIASSRARWGCK